MRITLQNKILSLLVSIATCTIAIYLFREGGVNALEAAAEESVAQKGIAPTRLLRAGAYTVLETKLDMNPATHGNAQGAHKILVFNNVKNLMGTTSRLVEYHLMLNGCQNTHQVGSSLLYYLPIMNLLQIQS